MEHSELLFEFFERQIPFNKHLGMTIDALNKGFCRLKIPFADHLVGDASRPALHGGVISTIADTAGGLAAFTSIDIGTHAVSTVDLRVDYMRRGLLQDIFCDATVRRTGNRVCATSMVVHHGNPDEYVCAEARGVYNIHRRRE